MAKDGIYFWFVNMQYSISPAKSVSINSREALH